MNETISDKDTKKRKNSSRKNSRKKSSAKNEENKKGGKDGQKDFMRCIFCNRKNCDDCPLPFDDRLTLRGYLTRSKASSSSLFYYRDDDEYNLKRSAAKQKNLSQGKKSAQQTNDKNNKDQPQKTPQPKQDINELT